MNHDLYSHSGGPPVT